MSNKLICCNCYYEKIGNEIKNITEELPFEIPNNWSWVRLNELGQFRKGPFGSSLTKEMFVAENTPNRIKVYEQKNAIQKNCKLGKYYITYEKFLTMESFKVEPEDIIVSCAGTIGEIYILPTDSELGIINQALMRIKLYHKNITNYFLMYFDFVLKKEANEKGNGTGMKNIPPFDILKKMLVPLPPINEMNKIISKLDILLAKCDDISLETNSLNSTINQIKQKILDYYFGENSCYKSYYSYNEEKLMNIASLITKGSTPTTYGFKYLEQGISFIKVENVKNGKIDHCTINQYISQEANDFQKRSQLEENDILFSIAGTIGRTCIVTKNDLPANTNQAFAIIRGYDSKIIPEYLELYLNWYVYRKTSLAGHGAGMLNVTLNDLKTMVINYPINKNTQKLIVDKIINIKDKFEMIS